MSWDDRRAHGAHFDDLRPNQVRGFLRDVRSALVDEPEPTKVYIHPDRTEITSYPGPVAGIEAEHLVPAAAAPAAPARSRRIGELLEELKLAEGRLTGLSRIFRAMAENGSPVPRFDFDAGRTWFRATLPVHPEHAGR